MQGTQAARRMGELYALSQAPTSTVADMRANALAATKKKSATRSTESNFVDLSMSGSSISSVSASFASASSSASGATFGSKRRHQAKGQPSIDENRNFGPSMTQAEADKIIIAEVKAIMHRGDPPGRLLDPYVKAGLLQRHPALWDFLPRDEETIYNRYIIFVDHETTDELTSFIKKIPGRCNIAMDGATVNGKQKVSTLFLFCPTCIH